jgi:hypothetical protein
MRAPAGAALVEYRLKPVIPAVQKTTIAVSYSKVRVLRQKNAEGDCPLRHRNASNVIELIA